MLLISGSDRLLVDRICTSGERLTRRGAHVRSCLGTPGLHAAAESSGSASDLRRQRTLEEELTSRQPNRDRLGNRFLIGGARDVPVMLITARLGACAAP